MAATWVFALDLDQQGEDHWFWTASTPEIIDCPQTFTSFHACALNAHRFGFTRDHAFHVVPARHYVEAVMQE